MYRFPLWGRSPANLKDYSRQVTQQGKGIDDHLLPLGDWFSYFFSRMIVWAKQALDGDQLLNEEGSFWPFIDGLGGG